MKHQPKHNIGEELIWFVLAIVMFAVFVLYQEDILPVINAWLSTLEGWTIK